MGYKPILSFKSIQVSIKERVENIGENAWNCFDQKRDVSRLSHKNDPKTNILKETKKKELKTKKQKETWK